MAVGTIHLHHPSHGTSASFDPTAAPTASGWRTASGRPSDHPSGTPSIAPSKGTPPFDGASELEMRLPSSAGVASSRGASSVLLAVPLLTWMLRP